MFVVGTAGHVDHGKSTLVRALTGIDPDRLQEEKERGMTIDLGFAWLKLPSGREISIVDVPGHERFIKNMLAGVGGIDMAMLVIAADESVMPQTREHLAILDLLRVRGGVVAVTKQDLVEPEWLELVLGDIEEALQGTVMAGAALVPVSAVTGAGLPELLRSLDERLGATTPKRDIGKPRLPVDRVFTVAGFGTVVTGTLIDGRFQVGQEVELLPSGRRTRIRGIQTHRERHDTANPGTRVALNLANIAVEEVRRGDVVTVPGAVTATRYLDVRLTALRDAPPLPHNAHVSVHTGSAEALGRVALLESDVLEPGESTWAQLKLERSIAVAKGDLFIIRSPNATLGGGEVVDPRARRHRRRQAQVLTALETLQRGSPEEVLLHALRDRRPTELAPVIAASGLSAEVARAAAANLVAAGEAIQLDGHYIDAPGWQRLRETAESILGAYHRAAPLRQGLPREELKSRLGLSPRVFTLVLRRLAEEGVVAEAGSLVRLSSHAVRFTPEQSARIDQLFARMLADRYSPPSITELEAELGLDPEVTNALMEHGRLVRLAENVVFPTEVYREIVDRIVAFLREHGTITVAQARDLFGTSRKYALAIMEHLDEARITRRVGDDRVLR